MKYLHLAVGPGLALLCLLAILNESYFDRRSACSDLADKHSLMTGIPSFKLDYLVIDDECFIVEQQRLTHTVDGELFTTERVMVSPESIRAAWKTRKQYYRH